VSQEPLDDGTELPVVEPKEQKPQEVVNHDDGIILNELGKVMILMYHQIGDKEGEWVRTIENFKKDLKLLYDKGYRPVALLDFLSNNMDMPRGTTPVVITFDDGTIGQFRILEEDGKIVVDPDSAVGMMEEFHRRNPDFLLRATFYINYPTPFGQRNHIVYKLNYLVERGMEIGNHTYGHPYLNRISPEQVQKEFATHVEATAKYVPGYVVSTLALPFGIYPVSEHSHLAVSGEYRGVKYNNKAILRVGSEPALAPIHINHNPLRLPRVRASSPYLEQWLKYFDDNPMERYISDGNPNTITIPQSRLKHLNKDKLGDKELIILENK
jgi:peptidoglycan/xylan/chitin deacetylase (PgdA/CDA1 family)